ncbi:MAG: hypothetical protein UW48_C0020G0001 [Microgenomates group bacterium GW2011_GWC1_44_23]|nr:MAG: hypothetical protein UW48_C0020G0001 [Microgenomates group bacterium GW2011_GWC1_44_23]
MRSEVLGLPVDVLSRVETINMIDGWLRQSVRKPRMVVTAYSEFYVKAQKDRVFAEIVRKADLVTPDGVSVLAGVRYNQRTQGIKNARTQGRVIKLMVEGLRVKAGMEGIFARWLGKRELANGYTGPRTVSRASSVL